MPGPTKILKPTTCRICGDTFYGPAEGVGGGAIILGEEPNKRALRYTATLVKHLETKHPDQITDAHRAGAAYSGMLKMSHFDIGDELLDQQSNFMRWYVHKESTRNRVTDQRIFERLQALFTEALSQDCSKAVRDVLTDPNLFEPNMLGDKLVMLFRLMRDSLEEVNEPPNPFAIAEAQADQPVSA